MITFENIEQIVCSGEGHTTEAIKVKKRKRELVFTRQLIFYLSMKYAKMTLESVGAKYNKDHATVHHACKTVENLAETDKDIREKLTSYENQLKVIRDYEKQIVTDKKEEVIELIKTLLMFQRPIHHETIAIYNKLIEKNETHKLN